MNKTIKTNAFLIEVSKHLLEELALSEFAIEFLFNSLESRLKNEKRKTFFVQSGKLGCGFYVEKENQSKIVIKDIVNGDTYYNSGMLTFELEEFLKEKEKAKDNHE